MSHCEPGHGAGSSRFWSSHMRKGPGLLKRMAVGRTVIFLTAKNKRKMILQLEQGNISPFMTAFLLSKTKSAFQFNRPRHPLRPHPQQTKMRTVRGPHGVAHHAGGWPRRERAASTP